MTVQKGTEKRAVVVAIFAVSAAALYSPVGALAQDAQPIEQPPEPPPLVARPPAEIGDETGEVGLPGGFFIEFGDKNDWIQFKAGEWPDRRTPISAANEDAGQQGSTSQEGALGCME